MYYFLLLLSPSSSLSIFCFSSSCLCFSTASSSSSLLEASSCLTIELILIINFMATDNKDDKHALILKLLLIISSPLNIEKVDHKNQILTFCFGR